MTARTKRKKWKKKNAQQRKIRESMRSKDSGEIDIIAQRIQHELIGPRYTIMDVSSGKCTMEQRNEARLEFEEKRELLFNEQVAELDKET